MTPSPHILIVDDDREIRTLLAQQLEGHGFRTSRAEDGRAMRRVLDREPVDLIVLDLNLPREDGLKLCRDLRATSSIPVIMLTARGDPIDRIVGLEIGADDYLPKPFEPRELLARIRSVLRRAATLPANFDPPPAKRTLFAGWVLDHERRHLLDRQGRIIPLSGAEYRLMAVFAAHPNRVLSRDQLHLLTSGRATAAPDRAIDLQVSRLRQKLAEDARTPEIIKTVRSEGYVLAAAVSVT